MRIQKNFGQRDRDRLLAGGAPSLIWVAWVKLPRAGSSPIDGDSGVRPAIT